MIIAIDFDGTCVKHAYPEIGEDIGAVPVLKEMVKNGHQLILNTMRSGKLLDDAIKWFSDNGMPMKFFIKRYLDSPESIDPTKEKTDYSINKPQYIDLDNIILYQLFEKIRLNDVVCIISECQPDIPENENVSEYIVEVTQ